MAKRRHDQGAGEGAVAGLKRPEGRGGDRLVQARTAGERGREDVEGGGPGGQADICAVVHGPAGARSAALRQALSTRGAGQAAPIVGRFRATMKIETANSAMPATISSSPTAMAGSTRVSPRSSMARSGRERMLPRGDTPKFTQPRHLGARSPARP